MRLLTLILTLTPLLGSSTTLQTPSKNKSFHYAIDLEYDTLSRSIDQSDGKVSSQVNDLLRLKFEMHLLPQTYDIKLSYTRSITDNVNAAAYNPNNYNKETQSYKLIATPYYHKQFGGLALFHTKQEQNSHYTNLTASAMPLVSYQIDNSKPSGWDLLSFANDLASNQAVQYKEAASYTGFKYLLPQNDYLPKGFNIYYSTMDRSTLYYARYGGVDSLIALSGKGKLYGLGVQRSLHELPNKQLCVDLIQISKGGFSGFPAVKLSEYSAGLAYKSDQWYVKGIALLYVAESFESSLNNKSLITPKQQDIFASLHLGISF